MASYNYVLGLDYGQKRIGLARASMIAQLPEALTTLANDINFIDNLKKIIAEENIDLIVVGLPRSMAGEETMQSKIVVEFAHNLKMEVDLPIIMQDETLSTVEAEKRFAAQLNKGHYIDQYAAVVILEDYFKTLKLT